MAQFYDRDEFLEESVSRFVLAGLHDGERVAMVATHGRRHGVARQLARRGADLPSLRRTGRLVWLDAADTLARFMDGRTPNRDRTKEALDEIVRNGRAEGGLRIYGEMVDVLMRDGNAAAALGLEGLWNEQAERRRFSLLCSYGLAGFDGTPALLDRVCQEHGRVIPCEGYADIVDGEARQREVVSLQLQARALRAEIRRREDLDAALDAAGADRERLLGRERAARAEASAASRLKDEFVALLSHELRTPLNVILGWSHLMSRPGADRSRMGFALQVIERNAALQLRLVDDLLDVSRIVAGEFHISEAPLNLAEVVRSAFETVGPSAASKRIDMRLAPGASAVAVAGDRRRLEQAIGHLLTNAVKFTPVGGRVDVSVHTTGREASVIIEDTGQGISPQFLPYVFDRFSRGDVGLARKHGGLGLGLAIVRHIVQAHRGTVSATSDGEGRGATFSVELPLVAG